MADTGGVRGFASEVSRDETQVSDAYAAFDDFPDPGVTEADEAALRALLTRLRGQIAEAEAQAYAEWQDLRTGVSNRDNQEEFQAAARAVARRQSAAASELQGLASELRVMADSLEARGGGQGLREDALSRLAADVCANADQLAFRVAEGQSWAREAMNRFSERLEHLESAANDRASRDLERLAVRIEQSETRRQRELSQFVDALSRRQADRKVVEAQQAIQAETPPVPVQRVRRHNHRPAAALLSAGVACLGFVTLAVVTAPTPQGQRVVEAVKELVLRGRILIGPPREARDTEAPAGPATVPTPGSASGVAAESAFAAAMTDLQAGRAGAVQRIRGLADGGLVRAQMQMATLYETGRGGMPVDLAEARRWTARAADAGNPVAMYNLALFTVDGRGGPKDEAGAARLTRRAAIAGVTDAQFNLGLMYEDGVGVDRNLAEAYKWFQVAAGNGDLNARNHAVALETKLTARELVNADRVALRFTPGQDLPEEAPLIRDAATVAAAQLKLAQTGYYIGPTDGQDSPAYRQAVAAYRRDHEQRTTQASR